MKSPAIKTTPTTAHSSIKFWGKSGKGSFFSQSQGTQESFFKPLQRKCNDCEKEYPQKKEEKIQMKQGTSSESNPEPAENDLRTRSKTSSAFTSMMGDRVSSSAYEAESLPAETKDGMETAFGENFSDVSIHKNSSKASELNALAFTQGESISFAPGQYDPVSQKGQELLGHELTHVVQQREGRVQSNTRADMLPANDDQGLEKEADDMGKRIARQTSAFDVPVGQLKKVSAPSATPPLQFRLPTYTNLESVFKDATLAIPESVVVNMVSTALTRMKKSGLLLSSDTVPVIISKIFPGPGIIVQSEFDKAVDVTNRNRIYKTVLDTNAPVKAADRGKLKFAMKSAVDICQLTPSLTIELKKVFGSRVAEAKDIYKKAGDELNRLKASDAAMDAGINTDYNRDDPALDLAGWADHGVMHLESNIAQVKDEKETVITLIHEASHLASSTVIDKGYYPPSTDINAFEGADEDRKITNAAYFEEFPRRWLSKSAYPKNTVFTPGKAAGGKALTLEDRTRDEATEYFRKAWDVAVEVQWFLRDIQKDILKKVPDAFNAAKKTIAKEVSQKMDLSIHKQNAGSETVTQLDIVLAEGVANVASIMGNQSAKLPVTAPLAADADIPAAAQQLIKDTIAANKTLLNDPARDKVLLDWLVGNYPTFP